MTSTDDRYTEFLNGIMPAGWMDNVKRTYTPDEGVIAELIGRIGRTEVNAVDNFENPFAHLTKANIDGGDTIQDYKITRIKGQPLNAKASGTQDYDMFDGEVLSQYAKINDPMMYPLTVYDVDFRKAFTSRAETSSFVSMYMESIGASDADDKITKWKKYICNIKEFAGTDSVVVVPNDENYLQNVLFALGDFAEVKFKDKTGKYNNMGDKSAMSVTPDIWMLNQDKLDIKRRILAGIYHPDMLNIDATIRSVDSLVEVTYTPPGGTAGQYNIVGVTADTRMFGYYPFDINTETKRNASRNRTNVFLKFMGTYKGAKFRNIGYVLTPVGTATSTQKVTVKNFNTNEFTGEEDVVEEN